MATTAPRTAGKTILANSFWYGLEQALELIIFLGTSIVVARTFSTDELGHFNYINFFVTVITSTGGSGLALATRKYMSEYIAQDQLGLACAVYKFTWRYQLMGSLLISGFGIAAVWIFGDVHFRIMGTILLASLVPGVMSWVPANANVAFQDMQKNTLSAVGYLITYAITILLAVYLKWGLAGIAAASLVGRTVEMVARTIPFEAKMRTLPVEKLPQEMVTRVRNFCLQGIGLQVVGAVVWNRTEYIFLGEYSTFTQVAFYSVSMGLASKLLVVPRTFSGATGITLMAESGRDPSRIDSIVKNASRYLLLVGIPVHLGAAAIAAQAIRVIYGTKYIGAVPAMVIASLLSLPLAFQEIPENLLRAADRQNVLIKWLIVTAVLNITLDWILIPRYASAGAAWGNGLAQVFGLCAIWIAAQRAYPFRLPMGTALRLLAAGSVMAIAAYAITTTMPGKLGLVLAILSAAVIYMLLVKLLRGLEPSDRERLAPIGNRLPRPMRRAYSAAITFVTPTV